MVRIFQKFRLLMWKNFKLQLRQPLETILIFVVGLFYCFILMTIRKMNEPEYHSEGLDFQPFDFGLSGNRLVTIWNVLKYADLTFRTALAFSPCNPDLEKIVSNAHENLKLPKGSDNVKCFDDGELLENALKIDKVNFICGIQFEDDLAGKKNLHKNMKITIRWDSVGSLNYWQAELIFFYNS